MFFPYQMLSFQIKDLKIRKFIDKYLLCVFSYNKFPTCSEMTGWGDSGSHTGARTTPSGGFLYGFNIVGRLGPLHEAGQTVGLWRRRAYLVVGLGLKSHGTHKAPLFFWLKVCNS